jgi:hypothetical protein
MHAIKSVSFFVGAVIVIVLGTKQSRAQIYIGPKAGINIANVVTDSGYLAGGFKNIIVYHAGAVAQFGVAKNFSIDPELCWLQKGWHLENATTDVKRIFNTIDLQVLAKYTIPFSEKFFGYADAGPTISYALSCTKQPEGGDKVKVDFDAEMISRFDYGIGAGIGLGMKAGKGKLFVDGRYMLSFSDVFEEEANKGKFRFTGFDYTLNYIIPIASKE